MKTLYISVFIASMVISVAGQYETVPVTIIKHEWRAKLAQAYSMAEKDPFETIRETDQDIQRRRDALKRAQERRERGLPAENPPVRPSRAEGRPHGPAIEYLYTVTLRNDAPKKIKRIVWEYIFMDRETGVVAGRRHFEKDIEMGSRRTRTITMRSQVAPTGAIDAKKVGKDTSALFSERIRIQRLDYADGSTWQAKPDQELTR
jgi:hypothetical protein